MPLGKSRNPWEVLLLAVAGCTVCFMVAVGGLMYGFAWLWNGQNDTAGEAPALEEVPSATVPEIAPPANPSSPGEASVSTTPEPKAGEDVFRDLVIPAIEIKIPAEAVLRLTVNPRSYVRVSVSEGQHVYTNVALRLKGGPGSFQRLHDTPSFTINFDKFAPGQKFHGLKKIHLNSSVQDRSFLNEKISRELFDAAGVPVPRAGHAIATINSRDPRLYVLVEGINKQFLKRYFKNTDGDVYDGHSQTDVTDRLPLNSGNGDPTRLRDLANAAREPNLELRLEKLQKTLDLDRFLSFVAMELILSHWDGYTMNRNNFRIAHNRDTDQMVFIPHGLDQTFANPRQNAFSPTPAGLVARAALQIPEVRRRYQDRVAELTTNVFRVSAITNRIYEVSERIAAALEEVDPKKARSFHQTIAPEICRRIRQRGNDLNRSLLSAAQVKPAKLNAHRETFLTNWISKVDLGEAKLTQEKDERGHALLHIGTSSGCTASWRTTAVLDAGRYQLEARIKTRDVVFDPDDPRAGAGLRISRYRTGQKNDGNHDWFAVAFAFDVQEDGTEKELICELRANRGEIWYDLQSIKLKQL